MSLMSRKPENEISDLWKILNAWIPFFDFSLQMKEKVHILKFLVASISSCTCWLFQHENLDLQKRQFSWKTESF